MIVVISDFDLRGSGYMNISTSLCQDLASRGYDVRALGYGYKGQEHHFDFSIIPVPSTGAVKYAATALTNLIKMKNEIDIEAIIVALDIPIQIQYAKLERRDIPYFGIFPVESGPLMKPWAMDLMLIDFPLVISKWGTQQAREAGLDAHYVEIGLDLEAWRRPSDEERAKLRATFGLKDDDFLILTVADNHERKNLSSAVRAIAKAREKEPNIFWALVSRLNYRAGWNVPALVDSYGLSDIFMPFERGLEFKHMWALYAAADAFLLPSKAEGLCMPILEAQATGTPVIATDCTAITEHLEDGRGLLCKTKFKTLDVWGNSWRHFVDIDDMANNIVKLIRMPPKRRSEMIGRAYEYVAGRNTRRAGDIIELLLNAVKAKKEEDVKKEIAKASNIAIL